MNTSAVLARVQVNRCIISYSISYYIVSFHILLYHFTSYCIISSHIVSFHSSCIISYRIVLKHITSTVSLEGFLTVREYGTCWRYFIFDEIYAWPLFFWLGMQEIYRSCKSLFRNKFHFKMSRNTHWSLERKIPSFLKDHLVERQSSS